MLAMHPDFRVLCLWFSIIFEVLSQFLYDSNAVDPKSINSSISCVVEIAKKFFVRRENVLIISTGSTLVAGKIVRLMELDFAINLATKHSQIDFSAISNYIVLADENMTDAYDAVENMSLNPRGRYVIETRNELRDIEIAADKFWNAGIPNVIFMQPLNGGNATVFGYEISSRRHHANAAPELRVLDHWEGKFTQRNNLFPNKFTNMNKYPLKISMILKSWTSSIVAHKHQEKKTISIGSKVLIEFANTMNFTFVQNEYPIPDKRSENSVWTERIGQLLRRKSDFIFAIIKPSHSLVKALDIAGPFKTVKNVFVMRTRQRAVSWNSTFKTFSTKLWTFLLLALVASLCLAMLVNRLWTMSVLKEYIRPIDVLKVYFAQSVVYPKHSGSRLAFALWMLYALLMTASFTGSLLKYLSTPSFQKDPETIEELSQSELMVTTVPELKKLLLETDDPALRRLGLRAETKMDFNEQWRDVWANGTATIMTDTSATRLNWLRRRNGSEQMRMIEGNIIVIPHFYYMWKGHPYREPLDRFIGQAKSAGLINKWVSEQDPLLMKERPGNEGRAIVLTLKHLASVFLVLACGCSVGIITFFFELYHGRRK